MMRAVPAIRRPSRVITPYALRAEPGNLERDVLHTVGAQTLHGRGEHRTAVGPFEHGGGAYRARCPNTNA